MEINKKLYLNSITSGCLDLRGYKLNYRDMIKLFDIGKNELESKFSNFIYEIDFTGNEIVNFDYTLLKSYFPNLNRIDCGRYILYNIK